MNLSPETQQLLNQVLATGKFATSEEALAEALRLLAQKQEHCNGAQLSKDEWRVRLASHFAQTPATTAKEVDVNRGSIYETRGE